MFLEKVTSQFDRSALVWAPLVPTAFFTAASVLFSGLLVAVFPSVAANLLLFTPLVFLGWYILGFVTTLVLGGLLIPLLPDELPLISRVNESRIGRIVLAVVILGVIGTGVLGLSGWTILFILMCLGEYTSRLPHRTQKPARKKGMFV